jgi:hypothetical protein
MKYEMKGTGKRNTMLHPAIISVLLGYRFRGTRKWDLAL